MKFDHKTVIFPILLLLLRAIDRAMTGSLDGPKPQSTILMCYPSFLSHIAKYCIWMGSSKTTWRKNLSSHFHGFRFRQRCRRRRRRKTAKIQCASGEFNICCALFCFTTPPPPIYFPHRSRHNCRSSYFTSILHNHFGIPIGSIEKSFCLVKVKMAVNWTHTHTQT